ncbi:MAG: universal stress protein [Cytophagales bacterium]|nr:MAG: universal stress protein [Cytophagales bacterium]TAF60956.1 MAG: universal stress protein [Cytophagales bacterium]
MLQIKKILVPIDFSVRSNAAFVAACNLAKHFDAEIHLLHVLEMPNLKEVTGDNRNSESLVPYLTKSTAVIKDKMTELKKLYPSVKTQDHVLMNKVHQQIFDCVETLDIDLILMGSSGAEGWDELLVGSNSQKVIRNANCPVLVVKNNKPFLLRNIVFASNFEDYSQESVDFVQTLQSFYNSKVHLLTVITAKTFEPSRNTRKRLNNFAVKYNLEHYEVHSYNEFSEEEGIVAYAEDCKADLIIMCTHGRTGVARMLAGSIAEGVANHSSVSVCTFKLI